MVKYVVLVLGVIFLILGIWGVIVWWPDFLTVLKGGGCPFLAFIGAIMAIAAISEIRDAIARKKEEEKEKEQEKQEQEKQEQETQEEQKQE